MQRLAPAAAGLLGFAAVALGAAGSHVLQARLGPDDYAVFETAVLYQLVHSLALLAAAVLLQSWPRSLSLKLCCAAFFGGTLLFSGSLYLRLFDIAGWTGPLAPLGGTLLMLGWLLLVVAAVRHDS